MISFKKWLSLQEVKLNHIAKDETFEHVGHRLGDKIPIAKSEQDYHYGEGFKKIGSIDKDNHVYHNHFAGYHTYAVGNVKDGRAHTILTANQGEHPKTLKVDILQANKNSVGAHKLYQHLVTKHDRTIMSNDQSEGARKVWAKAAKHPQINVHGWDDKKQKAFHLHPNDDEEFVSSHEVDAARDERWDGANHKIRNKAEKELNKIHDTMHQYIVMHKKDTPKNGK